MVICGCVFDTLDSSFPVFQETSQIFIFAMGNLPGFEGQTYRDVPYHIILGMLEVFSIQALVKTDTLHPEPFFSLGSQHINWKIRYDVPGETTLILTALHETQSYTFYRSTDSGQYMTETCTKGVPKTRARAK